MFKANRTYVTYLNRAYKFKLKFNIYLKQTHKYTHIYERLFYLFKINNKSDDQ